MEKITFDIWKLSHDTCRIDTQDIRTDIRKISGGNCIDDIETLFAEMERIRDEASIMGYEVVFSFPFYNNIVK